MNHTISEFKPVVLRQLRQELEDALKPIGERYGIALQLGNFSYSSKHAHVKLEANVVTAGVTVSKEAEDFKHFAARYGMDPDWLGKPIVYGGKTYTIAGLKISAPKNNVMLERDGKQYFGQSATVISMMKATKSG